MNKKEEDKSLGYGIILENTASSLTKGSSGNFSEGFLSYYTPDYP